MIDTIDNFLNPIIFSDIQGILMGEDIPWFWQDTVVSLDEQPYDYGFQFTHIIYNEDKPQSLLYEKMMPIFNKLDVRCLIRVKANLSPMAGKIVTHRFHVDFPYDNSKTAIMYLNTNNGYTIFKSGKKVDSIENRVVKFNCSEEHTGTTCTDAPKRVVLNINYF